MLFITIVGMNLKLIQFKSVVVLWVFWVADGKVVAAGIVGENIQARSDNLSGGQKHLTQSHH